MGVMIRDLQAMLEGMKGTTNLKKEGKEFLEVFCDLVEDCVDERLPYYVSSSSFNKISWEESARVIRTALLQGRNVTVSVWNGKNHYGICWKVDHITQYWSFSVEK